MYKKRTSVLFAVWIVSVIFLCLTAEGADAFCVYNNSDLEFQVQETHGGRKFKEFIKVISPGNHACCNWKNKDCNAKGKKDSTVKFLVAFTQVLPINLCVDFPVKAGGWLSVSGDRKSPYKCEAYFDESWDKDGDDQ
ncbi:MAG: hypothetical protein CVU61_14135 [Deltaproteobacteria bacterium HGW-Deltaproteobacteria-19]|nr:MAG: hypothetical protein CVU61_14135 [Deltaproteobacteria bacterium HGW-Deltaproteobacteria-19]